MRIKQFHLVTGGTPGLINDAKVVSDALGPGFSTAVHVSRQRNLHLPHQQGLILASKLLGNTEHLGIFFENIPFGWQSVMRDSVIVPNQEWLRPETLLKMHQCRQIWCKTRYAERLFQQRGLDAHYIGFSARDCVSADVPKDYCRFVHIQGRSQLKGTQTILATWAAHPEWPQLTVISRDAATDLLACSNITLINEYLSDMQLKTLMNSAGVHLCTSETEGFGHYISEALSTGAIVVTTDAPPMHELVRPDFGVLVAYEQVTRQGASERFHISSTDFAAQIERLIAMSQDEKLAMGTRARRCFVDNASEFRLRIRKAANEL